jgi:hypothetical protein
MLKHRFARLPLAVVFDRRLPAATLRVLAALATYTNRENHCFPAVTTLAKRLGLKSRAVQYQLRRLEALGYLKTVRRSRDDGRGGSGSNGYTILFPELDPANSFEQSGKAGGLADEHRGATPDQKALGDGGAQTDCAPPCKMNGWEVDTETCLPDSRNRNGVAGGAQYNDNEGANGLRPGGAVGLHPNYPTLNNPTHNHPKENQPSTISRVSYREVAKAVAERNSAGDGFAMSANGHQPLMLRMVRLLGMTQGQAWEAMIGLDQATLIRLAMEENAGSLTDDLLLSELKDGGGCRAQSHAQSGSEPVFPTRRALAAAEKGPPDPGHATERCLGLGKGSLE